MKTHVLARSEANPAYKGKRFHVPDSLVSWYIEWPDYSPIDFTHPIVSAGPVWADPPKYDKDDYPKNPIGRTGTCGRGLLGKWGANYAADPIVMYKDKIIMIKRKDTGDWALPGGMVDPNEKVATAAIRELIEEAFGSAQKEKAEDIMKMFHSMEAQPVYTGYVDDPRNTDNAWMETGAFLFLLSDEQYENMPSLSAADDAIDACWLNVKDNRKIYANHMSMINIAIGIANKMVL